MVTSNKNNKVKFWLYPLFCVFVWDILREYYNTIMVLETPYVCKNMIGRIYSRVFSKRFNGLFLGTLTGKEKNFT